MVPEYHAEKLGRLTAWHTSQRDELVAPPGAVAGSTPTCELGRVPLRAAQSIKMLSKKGPFYVVVVGASLFFKWRLQSSSLDPGRHVPSVVLIEHDRGT
jgi:hypothetical protein